jgi:excisionase family DNA binding protein
MVERWLSVNEIAAHLGISRETVYRWIDSKALPGHRIGKFWKFKTSEVDKWASHPLPTTSNKKHSVDGNRAGKRSVSRKSS